MLTRLRQAQADSSLIKAVFKNATLGIFGTGKNKGIKRLSQKYVMLILPTGHAG